MKSSAATPEEYIAELPGERAEAISKVRKVILENLPEGYVEAMNWGMISYEVPLSVFPGTYNKKPLMYAALASQKNHMAVYLCGLNCVPGTLETFKADYKKTGKKPDIGASCIRFKKLEDLPLDLIGKTIAATPIKNFIEISKAAHSRG